MKIQSKWEGNILVVEASECMKTTKETILRCHTSPSYGKLLGTEYSYFKTHGNHIACSFPQRLGLIKYSLTFEKVIERFPGGETRIYFRTRDSIADMTGVWTVQKNDRGTLLSLTQETRIPTWARVFPVKKLITSKIQKVFDELKMLH
jgi:hypothetical protein